MQGFSNYTCQCQPLYTGTFCELGKLWYLAHINVQITLILRSSAQSLVKTNITVKKQINDNTKTCSNKATNARIFILTNNFN